MTVVVREVALVPKESGVVERSAVPDVASLIEKMAASPDFDVHKLEQLIGLQERLIRFQAKAAFDRAFAAFQGELPVVVERSKANTGSYAALEDIMETVRPILARHGFSLSHRTEWPEKGIVRIVGILAHAQGHEKTSEFLTAADTSGSKNAVQALGSAVAYGRRYTTKDLLLIVTRGEDDDAKRSGQANAPEGFEEWLDALKVKATEGLPALQAMWKTANEDRDLRAYAAHLQKHHASTWNELKKSAARIRSAEAK